MVLLSAKEIDKYNIFNATLLSMERAAKKLKKKPHIFLVDGTHAPKKLKNSKTIIKGDQKLSAFQQLLLWQKLIEILYMIKLEINFPSINGIKILAMVLHNIWASLKKFGVTNFHRRSYQDLYTTCCLDRFL